MTLAEIQVKINLARREMEFWQNIAGKKSCRDCTHYAMPECDKFNAAPPPDVVKTGCEEWTWDQIPF